MLRNSFLLMDGVGERTEQRIWEQGITTWEDFRSADDINRIGDQRKQRHDRFLDKAEKNLDKQNAAFFDHTMPQAEQWRLYREFDGSIAYLDIETTGLDQRRDDITTVSIYDGDDATTLVQGQDLSSERLAKELKKHGLLVTFNGKRFDMPFISESLGVDPDMPHVDLMYACKQVGLSGGLKAIENQLGIGRDDIDDIDGREAIRLWKQYQRGNQDALETLVTYNQKDVINLKPLMEETYHRLTERKFSPYID
ncbi:MAG: ribonuclease H-like domain-containing protein [Candidatus Nanohaloarchaea archaeon]|nr:ribonuclease H-like domain-containing protein [Candidatus Nanohaloarchaea archaeon]